VGEPTPEKLKAWAEWFENPNKSPALSVSLGSSSCLVWTPGYLLRVIATEMRHPTKEDEDE
jgi:hypothetical protein